jgi:hypothetical protein
MAAPFDQLLEVAVERLPRREDGGLVFGDVASEGLADVGRPIREERIRNCSGTAYQR